MPSQYANKKFVKIGGTPDDATIDEKEMKLFDFYRMDMIYAVTINPDDAHQWFGHPDRYSNFINFYDKHIFQPMGNAGIQYVFHPELSNPKEKTSDKNSAGIPRLHFHGLVYLETQRSVMHFLMNSLYKIASTSMYDVGYIDNIKIWERYCRKQEYLGHKGLAPTCPYSVWYHFYDFKPTPKSEELIRKHFISSEEIIAKRKGPREAHPLSIEAIDTATHSIAVSRKKKASPQRAGAGGVETNVTFDDFEDFKKTFKNDLDRETDSE